MVSTSQGQSELSRYTEPQGGRRRDGIDEGGTERKQNEDVTCSPIPGPRPQSLRLCPSLTHSLLPVTRHSLRSCARTHLVGLLLSCGGLPVPTGLLPNANFPAGLLAKLGINFIPSAISASFGSNSSPTNRAVGRDDDAPSCGTDEGRWGVWNEGVDVDWVHQSVDAMLG